MLGIGQSTGVRLSSLAHWKGAFTMAKCAVVFAAMALCTRHAVRVLVFAALLLVGACSPDGMGSPRIAVSSRSPDGHHRAFVQNRPSLDPPAQSLWLASGTAAATQLRKLSEDQDWCGIIEWSGDSRTVAFLVQDARLIVVDVTSRQIRDDRWLVAQDGYPPTHLVAGLSLSRDGSSVRFKACRRGTGSCTDRVEALGQR